MRRRWVCRAATKSDERCVPVPVHRRPPSSALPAHERDESLEGLGPAGLLGANVVMASLAVEPDQRTKTDALGRPVHQGHRERWPRAWSP